MTTKELKRTLLDAGWTITEGGNHSLATHKDIPGIKIPIPRHTGNIPIGTLNSILKAARLK